MDLEKLEQARAWSEQTIFLVGTSFLLGSLCTIFLLLMLDFMKARRQQRETEQLIEDDFDADQ